MNAITPAQPKLSAVLTIPVIVASLGYFVDVYDLLLFNIVRVPSLKDLGLSEEEISRIGANIYNWQQAGLLIGGFMWGILGDKLGRRSVLFGSIFTYSLANIACGFANNVELYSFLRFIAGLGLAGELGAGITLIAEILPKELRGYGASVVASVGLAGAIAAFFAVKLTDWRIAYFIGGGMGLILLGLRINVLESVIFNKSIENRASKSVPWWTIFTSWSRFVRYIRCMGIGLPTYMVIGIYSTFGNEFAKALGITADVQAASCVLYTYIGVVTGDFFSGILSQWLQSRRKAILLMMSMTLAGVVWLLYGGIESTTMLYACYVWLGFSIGYIAMFLTTTAEQFGTNLRATVTTSVANNVRATVLITLPVFQLLKPGWGVLSSGAIVGAVCFGLALLSLWKMEETYGKELDYEEV
ncbi:MULTISPECIES: MFS transporter [Dyadobacter]|uniref:MFS transporter n=1 Tax=Dyadobacter chenhuakuii TaxID=2909339 RepID=A0A9X1QFH1_9BACT|nr:MULTISPECIES: MFS transporter [Dyadobacter]MCE7069511.1 MFS transporter [Dyadobacter sp. CY327]MCF2498814.1 MFS transporter [Dyadobacter chenhuakuii]MCF2516468.1 MFS transporter [Dyadobacter sp. CY351]